MLTGQKKRQSFLVAGIITQTGFHGSSNRIRKNHHHSIIAIISRSSYEETWRTNRSRSRFLVTGIATYPSSSTVSRIKGLGRRCCNRLSSCWPRPALCDSKLHGRGLDRFHCRCSGSHLFVASTIAMRAQLYSKDGVNDR
jgi:hypothetical protein